MAVCNRSSDVTGHRLGRIEATTIEFFNISILNMPRDITGVIITICFTDTLLRSTCQDAKSSTVDIALSIVFIAGNVTTIETRKVKLVVITTGYGHWRMLGGQRHVLVGTAMELLEPHIAAHMEIGCLVGSSTVLSAHPLFKDTTL